MDEVTLHWTPSMEHGNMLIAMWGRTKIRVSDDTSRTAGGAFLDIFDADAEHRTLSGSPAPLAERFNNAVAAQNYAVAWIEQQYGQCWNRSLETGVRCAELSTRINELGSRYCVACYERYVDNLRSRGITVPV
jgi:hypothetical protein